VRELTSFVCAAAYPTAEAAHDARAAVLAAYQWNGVGDTLDAVVVRRSAAGGVAIATAEPQPATPSIAVGVVAAVADTTTGPGSDGLSGRIRHCIPADDRRDIREALLYGPAALLVVLEPERADDVRRALCGSARVVLRELVMDCPDPAESPAMRHEES